MELQSHTKGNIRILELAGRFDTQSVPEVGEWIQGATTSPPANVIVNLQDVTFLDSTALSTLVQGLKKSRSINGDLRLCGLQHPVRMIFELTRLDKAFEIFKTEEDAIEAFNNA
jgi:anti-sigma B factor antagonist